jgi:hypothetical protein
VHLCTQNEQCCSGECLPDGGFGRPCACPTLGDLCDDSADAFCCDAYCIGFVCRCGPAGVTCGPTDLCCNGACSGGVCP